MVLGKNAYREEGFKDEYRKALNRIPKDTIMTHWWYFGPYNRHWAGTTLSSGASPSRVGRSLWHLPLKPCSSTTATLTTA